MKKLALFSLLTVLLSSFAGSAIAESIAIQGVTFNGLKRVDVQAVQAQIKSHAPETSDTQISDDIKAIYRTGFFDSVEASRNDAQTLIFTVKEKAQIRKVLVSGNDAISDNQLKEALNFDSRRFADKTTIQGVIKKATSLYESKGYNDAKFTYKLTPLDEGQVDITFHVDEGARYAIEEIDFTGLRETSESDLRSVIQTKRYKWWSSWLFGTGRINDEMLDNDRLLIRQYLLDEGFAEAQVSAPQIKRTDDHEYLVTFSIDEGAKYKFGQLKATGDLINNRVKDTIEKVSIASGDTFSAKGLRDSSFAISDAFGDQGYAFANVVPDTRINREARTVDVTYQVSKGRPVTVNKIIIRGNEKTFDHVIRRELKIDEQEKYSSAKVKRSQDLLNRLGYFDEASITSEPVGDDKVNLLVNVKEGQTGSITAGAGYSTADGAIFSTKVADNNLFGTGRKLSVSADIGTERDSYVLSFEDPRVADSYWSGSADLFKTDRQYQDFDRELTGGSLGAGYPLEEIFGESFEDINFSTKLNAYNVDIASVDEQYAAPLIIASKGSSASESVTPRLVRNTINNPLNPSQGSRQELSFEYGGLGGDTDYWLGEAKNTFYQPLIDTGYGDIVFSMRTSLGYGESQNDDPFPLFKRYFPGGINSVRGYKTRTLGPTYTTTSTDANGQTVVHNSEFGGSKELVNNAELLFPLVNSAGIRGLFFYDIGNAFDDGQNINFSDLREGYGTGIRWSSPLGPIRIEFGFPVQKDGETGKGMQTMFSFGAPF